MGDIQIPALRGAWVRHPMGDEYQGVTDGQAPEEGYRSDGLEARAGSEYSGDCTGGWV